jgi:hypothetical protein
MTLILSRASISRPSGYWLEDDYDVVADGERIVGRISTSGQARPAETPWMWTVDFLQRL